MSLNLSVADHCMWPRNVNSLRCPTLTLRRTSSVIIFEYVVHSTSVSMYTLKRSGTIEHLFIECTVCSIQVTIYYPQLVITCFRRIVGRRTIVVHLSSNISASATSPEDSEGRLNRQCIIFCTSESL